MMAESMRMVGAILLAVALVATIVDGGNTNFHDDVRRHARVAEKGLRYVDAGTSGGIWGLSVGYCLMVGGDRDAVEPLEREVEQFLRIDRGDVVEEHPAFTFA